LLRASLTACMQFGQSRHANSKQKMEAKVSFRVFSFCRVYFFCPFVLAFCKWLGVKIFSWYLRAINASLIHDFGSFAVIAQSNVVCCWTMLVAVGRFLYELSQIPSFVDRCYCLLFQSTFAETVASVDSRLTNVRLIVQVPSLSACVTVTWHSARGNFCRLSVQCLSVLRTQFRRTSFARWSFSAAAPLTWNSLPLVLLNCNSFSSFKSRLKIYLFFYCFLSTGVLNCSTSASVAA